MNFKKIAITAAVAGTILASAMPAFANGWHTPTVSNWARVTNNVTTVANTGAMSRDEVEGGYIKFTGNALATGVVASQVNTNTLDCGCLLGRHFSIKNGANVTNNVTTVANTGAMANGDVEGGKVKFTGNAEAGSMVTNVVNTNTVGGVSESAL